MTDSSIFDLMASIKLAYPSGTYRECNWILAQRQIMRLQEQGVADETLVLAAEAYAAQQKAMGKVGSQYILSPENFYGAKGLPHYLGPFPLPKTEKELKAEAFAKKQAEREEREWVELEHRANKIAFRARREGEDLLGYRTLLERAESQIGYRRGQSSVAELLGSKV